MIGLEQEPNDDARGKLNAALGEGQYTVEYRETAGGVAIVVQTREMPSRVWSSQVAHGVPRASVDGVWQELTSRIAAECKGTPTTTAAHASQQGIDAEQTKRSKPPIEITGQEGVVAEDMGTIGGDDPRSLGEAPASNPESHGYPPIPDDLIKARDDSSDIYPNEENGEPGDGRKDGGK